MARQRHLKNAPIREALVDIAVTPRETLSKETFEALRDSVAAEYPKASEVFLSQFQFRPEEAENPKPGTKSPIGFQCHSADGKRIVQFRRDGFTCNWLKPYSTWEELKRMAQEQWSRYSEAAEPVALNRIALRYINNVVLPLPDVDFDEYLRAAPHIPEGLPQGLANFLVRTTIIHESGDYGAVVTQLFDGAIKANKLTVILDIDASRVVSLGPQDPQIWAVCDQLRDFKNRIFFESLTERAAEMYQ